MKKIIKMFSLLISLLIVGSVKASSIYLTCPDHILSNSKFKCGVYLKNNTLSGYQFEVDSDDVEITSETLTSNTKFEDFLNAYYNNSFILGNTKGLASSFKMGDLTLSIGEKENGIYDINIKNIIGSDGEKDFYLDDYNYKINVYNYNLRLSSYKYNYNKIIWDKIPNVKGYKVYRATSSTGKYTLVATTSNNYYKDSGLTFNKNYYYKIRTYSVKDGKNVYDAYSKVLNVKTSLNPVSFKVDKNTYNSLKVVLTSVSGAQSYRIYDCTDSCKLIKTTSDLSYLYSKLKLGNTYKIGVKACRKSGSSNICSSIKYVSNVVSPKKPSFEVTNKTDSSVKLTITKVSGASSYTIKYKKSSDEEYNIIETSELSNVISDLTIGSEYEFLVNSVYNTDSYSAYTKKTFTKGIVTPKSFSVSESAFRKIKLSWTLSNENLTYKVYRSTSKTSGYKLIASIKDNYYIDESILPNKTYYYKIRAYKNKTYSSYTSYKSIVTKLKTPSISIIDRVLTINEVDGALGYQIYSSSSKSGSYSKYKTVSDLETTIKKGYYKVRAYVKIDGKTYYSSFSKIKKAE